MMPTRSSFAPRPLVAALILGAFAGLSAAKSAALALAPEEFKASRQMACILAQQTLGQLSETEYGDLAHTVLDGFEATEQDTIIAKALGYYDGLMFSIPGDNADEVNLRLEDFVRSPTCSSGYRKVTHTL